MPYEPTLEKLYPAKFIHRMNVTPEQICANIRSNSQWRKFFPNMGIQRVAICASGPSLADHIEDIRARQAAGYKVASMNGSLKFLCGHGITPDLFFMIDSRKGKNLEFIEHAAGCTDTTFVIASQCDPEIFESLSSASARVLIWDVDNYAGAMAAIRESEPTAPIYGGAANVGQSCLNALIGMGFRVFDLFGYDASYRDWNPETRTGASHVREQPANAGDDVQEFIYEGKRYYASGTMGHHAQTFPAIFAKMCASGLKVRIFGDGLLPEIVKTQASAYWNWEFEKKESPVPKARRGALPKRLPIVTWLWYGHVPYSAEDVNALAADLDRHAGFPHELVCITDRPAGIDGAVRTVDMPREQFEHGKDWHRLRLFDPEFADIIGSRFAQIDLDTLVIGSLRGLVDGNEIFRIYKDPLRPQQYNTGFYIMDAGAFPHIWDEFDRDLALDLRKSGQYGGYDQAWISYALPGQRTFSTEDGIFSFRKDILDMRNIEQPQPLHAASALIRSGSVKMLQFHGKYRPNISLPYDAVPALLDVISKERAATIRPNAVW